MGNENPSEKSVIKDFTLPKTEYLSNFYEFTDEDTFVIYNGIWFLTVENAYQAAKTLDRNTQVRFASLTPREAKFKGRTVQLREDWSTYKLEVMELLLHQKFDYNNNYELAKKLINTGTATLIEGNWWGDTFWGVCKGVGENYLGKLLMKIRSELQERVKS